MTDWQPFEAAPKDGTVIRVTRRVGVKPFKPLNQASDFAWSAEKECWMQRVGNDWHRQFFEPTHWRI